MSNIVLLKGHSNLLWLDAGPMIEWQQSCFKFSLNIARHGKNNTVIFLYTISGTRSKEKLEPCFKRDIFSWILRTYF